jgi:hypothetical protein
MLFALPGYQFPYNVMNRCLYLTYTKVAGHIPARVRMPPPRVGGTYVGALTWVYKSTYQGVFTVHSAATILQAANGRF